MTNFRTHYDNLKVARNAPDSIIRAAYKTLMQQYHPDKFHGTEVEALRIAKLVKQSYDVLIDPIKRAEHNRWIDEQITKANEAEGKYSFKETSDAKENYYTEEGNKEHGYRYSNPPPKSDCFKENRFNDKSEQPIIWKRFFARIFDLWWETLAIGLVLGFLFGILSPNFVRWLNQPGSDIVFGFLCVPVALILDAVIHQVFGNTLGKAWLHLSLEKDTGASLNIQDLIVRNLSLWITGLGFGLPIIGFFPMAYQAYRIRCGKDATYDTKNNFKITDDCCSLIRKTTFVFAFLLLFVCIAILNSLSNKHIALEHEKEKQGFIDSTYANCYDSQRNSGANNSILDENIDNYCKCFSQDLYTSLTNKDFETLAKVSGNNFTIPSGIQEKINNVSERCMKIEISRISSNRNNNLHSLPNYDLAEYYYEDSVPYLVNYPPGSSMKIIKINLAILVKGNDGLSLLKKNMPLVRNNILMAISYFGADKANTKEGKIELRSLMLNEIGLALKEVTGNNPVKNIYYTDFVMQ